VTRIVGGQLGWCRYWREGAEAGTAIECRPGVHSGGGGKADDPPSPSTRCTAEMRPGQGDLLRRRGWFRQTIAWLSPWIGPSLKHPWVGRQQPLPWALAPFTDRLKLGDEMSFPCVQVDGQDAFCSRPGWPLAQAWVVASAGPLSATARPAPHLPHTRVCARCNWPPSGCARENTAGRVQRARALADPPDGSPVACRRSARTSVWDVLAKSPDRANETSFQRREMPSTRQGERPIQPLSGAQ